MGVVLQMVQQNDEKHDAGHHRLRESVRELEEQMRSVTARVESQEGRLGILKRRADDGPSVDSLKFPFRTVIQIIAGFFVVFGGMYASTYGLRSDVRDILTHQSLQKEVDDKQAKLQEERAASLKSAVEATQRRVELQQYEIQNLKELVLTLKEKQ